jgi:transposase
MSKIEIPGQVEIPGQIEVPGEIEVFAVKHLPIVKTYVEELGVVEVLNDLVASEMDVEPGVMFLGMILDTLSGRSPLYRVEEFFETQDTELLLGRPIEAKRFNDDNVGRFLDKLYETGTMKIFTEIAKRAVDRFGLSCRHVHFDTTSVSVFGAYSGALQREEGLPYEITYGHSKDHRADLKQFLIAMLCIERNVPIFGSPEDGNGSDKTINNAILTAISSRMAAFGLSEGAFIYIADSALITEDNLKAMGDAILFISRLPASYNECQRVIGEAVRQDAWDEIGIIAETTPTKNRPGTHYRAYETEVELYGKRYRAVVIHSSAHDRRRQKRLERELQAEHKSLATEVKKACKIDYACQADAEAAAKRITNTKATYYRIEAEVEERPKYKRGRPKGGVKEVAEMRYGISAKITEDESAVATLREEAGCFVLVSNVPKAEEQEDGYDSRATLQAYKEQHGMERNFGFLKDPAIVDSLFLDTPERIEALGLILLTALLIWRLMEREMRQSIEESGEPIPGWDHKPTRRPTSFMMTTKFSGVIVIKIGSKRILNREFSIEQRQFLRALHVSPEVFTQPRPG